MNKIWGYVGEKIILSNMKLAEGEGCMFWPRKTGAQPLVISIVSQIARSFPTSCGLTHDEKCREDRRKSVGATSVLDAP